MRTLISALVLLVSGLLASTAQAAALTFSPTPTGLTFTIENEGLVADLFGADGVSDTYAVRLTLTTSTSYVDSGSADLLAAFSVDFSSSSLDGLALAGSPAAYSWVLKPANEVAGNSAQCGGDQPGAACVEEMSSGSNLALDAIGTYSWLFHVDTGSGGFGDVTTLNVGIATLNLSNGRFKPEANFTALAGSLAPGPTGGQETTLPPDVPVPEPGSLVLLGSGLVFAASRMRRRKK